MQIKYTKKKPTEGSFNRPKSTRDNDTEYISSTSRPLWVVCTNSYELWRKGTELPGDMPLNACSGGPRQVQM